MTCSTQLSLSKKWPLGPGPLPPSAPIRLAWDVTGLFLILCLGGTNLQTTKIEDSFDTKHIKTPEYHIQDLCPFHQFFVNFPRHCGSPKNSRYDICSIPLEAFEFERHRRHPLRRLIQKASNLFLELAVLFANKKSLFFGICSSLLYLKLHFGLCLPILSRLLLA